MKFLAVLVSLTSASFSSNYTCTTVADCRMGKGYPGGYGASCAFAVDRNAKFCSYEGVRVPFSTEYKCKSVADCINGSGIRSGYGPSCALAKDGNSKVCWYHGLYTRCKTDDDCKYGPSSRYCGPISKVSGYGRCFLSPIFRLS